MATPIPLSSFAQIPVTPPPDHQTFGKAPLSPQVLKSFAQEMYGMMGGKVQPETVAPAARSVPLTTNMKFGAAASSIPAPIPGFEALNNSHANIGTSPTLSSAGTPPSPTAPAATAAVQHPMDPANDARYLAMASRIASYYQQRCQAVANYQQQRCQQWANMHRQKCQEMMQAAMLVVAWYVRDRISRKRKHARRRFKRGLAAKRYASDRDGPKVTKGVKVRRWIMDVPSVKGLGDEGSSSSSKENNKTTPKSPSRDPNLLPPHDELLDREEADFSMDRETPPDKDTKLFCVADNLIKSQLAKIDVPLLGALSFDESDSESEEDEDVPMYQDYDDDGGGGGMEEEDMVDEEDEGEEGKYYYDDDDEYDVEYEEYEAAGEGIDSEEVHVGTGQASRERTTSSVL